MSNQLYQTYRNRQLKAVHLNITAATNPSSGTGNGGSDNIASGGGSSWVLTVTGGAFTAADVGRYITVAGATNKNNNGNFLITAQGGTTATYTNASGVAQASFAGTWTVPITLTTSVPHNLLDNDYVRIANVLGTTAANGDWTIKATAPNLSTSQFQIFDGNNIAPATGNTYPGFPGFGVAGNGNYTAGGNVTNSVDWLGDNIKAVLIDIRTNHYSITPATDQFLAVIGTVGSSGTLQDRLDATSVAITNATNATPIVVSATNTFVNGQEVYITGVGGNTAANGTWVISSVSGSQFTLNNSIGNGAYTSGGQAFGGMTTTSPNLSTKTAINGGAGAALTTLPLVAADARSLGAIVVYKDTGSPFTSPLIAYIDVATGLPIIPSGGDISFSWQQTSPYIYTL